MNKIYKFMDGRYGIDELYKFLLIICTILILLNTIIKSKIIDIIELIILIISTIRFLSKNKSKRQKENQIYIKTKNKIIKYYQYQKKRYQDHNTHIYRKCPKCKQKIRLVKQGIKLGSVLPYFFSNLLDFFISVKQIHGFKRNHFILFTHNVHT